MNTKLLTEIMNHASKYSGKLNSTLPILKCAKIEICFGNLTIETTNLEKYFIVNISEDELEGDTDLEICTPAKILSDLLKRLDQNEPTYLEETNSYPTMKVEYILDPKTGLRNKPKDTRIMENAKCLHISNGNADFYIKSLDPTEYPQRPDPTNQNYETLHLKHNLTARLYTQESEIDPYISDRQEKSKANKLMPKYILIDNKVYNRDKDIGYDYTEREYYAYYYGINDEKRIPLSEIGLYDKIGEKQPKEKK